MAERSLAEDIMPWWKSWPVHPYEFFVLTIPCGDLCKQRPLISSRRSVLLIIQDSPPSFIYSQWQAISIRQYPRASYYNHISYLNIHILKIDKPNLASQSPSPFARGQIIRIFQFHCTSWREGAKKLINACIPLLFFLTSSTDSRG